MLNIYYDEMLGHLTNEKHYVKDGDNTHLVYSESDTHYICAGGLLFTKDVELITKSSIY